MFQPMQSQLLLMLLLRGKDETPDTEDLGSVLCDNSIQTLCLPLSVYSHLGHTGQTAKFLDAKPLTSPTINSRVHYGCFGRWGLKHTLEALPLYHIVFYMIRMNGCFICYLCSYEWVHRIFNYIWHFRCVSVCLFVPYRRPNGKIYRAEI